MVEAPEPHNSSAEPRMTAARYDARSGYVFVTLSNGASLAFPARLAEGLARASKADTAEVLVTGDGYVLSWDALGVFLSYLGILTDIFGARSHITRLAGPKRKSEAERAKTPVRRRPHR